MEKWPIGSPELVIEGKKKGLHDKAITTLAGDGAFEFWIVDPAARNVTVHRKTGMSVYGMGESLALPMVDGASP